MNARTAQAWIASLALCLAGSALAGPQASGDASAAPPVVAYAVLPEVTQGDRGSRAINCSGARWSVLRNEE